MKYQIDQANRAIKCLESVLNKRGELEQDGK